MLLNYNALTSVLHDTYFLSDGEAQKLTSLVAGLLTPNIEFERLDAKAIAAASYITQAPAPGAHSSRASNIGVVDIRGVLNKYDSLCAIGMVGYGRMITALDQDPEVDAIVLSFDSPGGSVSGTQELGDIISHCSKPVVGYVYDMAGSAAYWLVSCTDEIVANTTTAIVGSIGVMTSLADMRGYYLNQGINLRDIYPPESRNKNGEWRAAQQGNDQPIIDRLSVLAQKFQQKVRDNRSTVTDDQLTGATYFAGDVVGTLVDSIGTFEFALGRAAALAANHKTNNNKKPKTMAKTTTPAPAYAALAAAADVDSFESVDGTLTLSADQARAVESALSTSLSAVGRIPQLQEQLSQSQASAAALTGQLETATARVATLEAEAEAAPGADHAAITPGSADHAQGLSAGTDFASALAAARSFVASQN